MPTYLTYAREGRLTAHHREQLAQRTTRLHSGVTGAPTSFVQCVFLQLLRDGHFIGGKPAHPEGIHVHGFIRAGRTPDTKNRLITGIRDIAMAVTDSPGHLVWVYLTELTHTDMLEFGEVLPEPGNEEEWMSRLPGELREHLAAR
jgi:phenylpyruvate tautomerase PptA (4-oxalocrotonate tautomerase family)